MRTHSIFEQITVGSPAAAAFALEAGEMVTAPAGRPALANPLACLREHFGTIRDSANKISTSEFAGHGL